jgi:hypothetical protein
MEFQELLVGLKQVLNTEYRRGLYPLIDTLLDERYIHYFTFSCTVHIQDLFSYECGLAMCNLIQD